MNPSMQPSNEKPLTEPSYPSTSNNLADDYLWEIWMIKVSGRTTKISLLYSWIIPNELTKSGWQPVVLHLNETVGDVPKKPSKAQLLKAVYCGKGTTIKKYIDGLLTGSLLTEVSVEGETTSPPNEILNLGLGDSIEKIRAGYRIRPEVLLPVEHPLIPWQNKAIPNPVGFSTFVSQIVNLDKSGVISFEGITDERQVIQKLSEKIVTILRKDTSFDISRASAPRIGNIEWYRFPLADKSLSSLIKVQVIKGVAGEAGTGAELVLAPFKGTEPHIDIYIQCRLINGEEVSLDECCEVHWGSEQKILQFHSNQPVSELHLAIWKKDPATSRGVLIFEDRHVFVRSMILNMSMIGARINASKINLLTKLNAKEKKKAEELAVYSRSTKAGSTSVGGYDADPWVPSGRAAINYMDQLFPVASEGRFFVNGWDSAEEASGQMSFVEWMFGIISGEDRGGLLLIDPFFDKDGVEIFSHPRTTNTQYRILTCTQHREDDQVSPASPTPAATVNPAAPPDPLVLTGTAKSIQAACGVMLPLLRDFDLTISDLRSPNGGSTQLFHDRYILLTDQTGQVKKATIFRTRSRALQKGLRCWLPQYRLISCPKFYPM